MPKSVTTNKEIGETPLEALERFRTGQIVKDPANASDWKTVPMTYAGRLDPMAEGVLIILIGDECKKKEEYLEQDKEYEVEMIFGIETDSYDALGLPVIRDGGLAAPSDLILSKYIGRFEQEYPPYSSKTVGGRQLHELARNAELPNEMPTKDIEIYSIEMIGKPWTITPSKLLQLIEVRVGKVQGDFRQDDILSKWRHVLSRLPADAVFPMIKLRVRCSSGTYMRSLAHRIGKDLGKAGKGENARTGAFALSIKRTKIF